LTIQDEVGQNKHKAYLYFLLGAIQQLGLSKHGVWDNVLAFGDSGIS
jgi:hypothetical protein